MKPPWPRHSTSEPAMMRLGWRKRQVIVPDLHQWLAQKQGFGVRTPASPQRFGARHALGLGLLMALSVVLAGCVTARQPDTLLAFGNQRIPFADPANTRFMTASFSAHSFSGGIVHLDATNELVPRLPCDALGGRGQLPDPQNCIAPRVVTFNADTQPQDEPHYSLLASLEPGQTRHHYHFDLEEVPLITLLGAMAHDVLDNRDRDPYLSPFGLKLAIEDPAAEQVVLPRFRHTHLTYAQTLAALSKASGCKIFRDTYFLVVDDCSDRPAAQP